MATKKRVRELTKPAEVEASARFKAYLDTCGRSQADVGADVGVGQGTVWQWANNRLAVPADKAIGLARAVNASDPAEISAEWALLEKQREVTTSETASQSASRAARPDPLILAESIAVLRHLAKQVGWPYDPEVHAEITADTYELRAMLPKNPTNADVIDFGQKVAERLAREKKDGGKGRSGASAPVGGHDQGQHAGITAARKAGAKGRT